MFFDSALIDRAARCFLSSQCTAVCPYEVYISMYTCIVVRSFFTPFLPSPTFPFHVASSCCHYLIYFASLVCARVKKGFHSVVYICPLVHRYTKVFLIFFRLHLFLFFYFCVISLCLPGFRALHLSASLSMDFLFFAISQQTLFAHLIEFSLSTRAHTRTHMNANANTFFSHFVSLIFYFLRGCTHF